MTCERTVTGNGVMWICSRGSSKKEQCASCKTRTANKLCDYPLKEGKAGQTCSRPICHQCATTNKKVANITEERGVYREVEKLLTDRGKERMRNSGSRVMGGIEPDTYDLCPVHAQSVCVQGNQTQGDDESGVSGGNR